MCVCGKGGLELPDYMKALPLLLGRMTVTMGVGNVLDLFLWLIYVQGRIHNFLIIAGWNDLVLAGSLPHPSEGTEKLTALWSWNGCLILVPMGCGTLYLLLPLPWPHFTLIKWTKHELGQWPWYHNSNLCDYIYPNKLRASTLESRYNSQFLNVHS